MFYITQTSSRRFRTMEKKGTKVNTDRQVKNGKEQCRIFSNETEEIRRISITIEEKRRKENIL